MTQSNEDLLKLALNLHDPWYVKSIEFSNAKKRIDINIDFTVGSRFECPLCKTPNNSIHDTKKEYGVILIFPIQNIHSCSSAAHKMSELRFDQVD